MLRALAAFLAVFAGTLVALLVAVGQLGRVDTQTLVAILVAAGLVASAAAWRGRTRP